MPITEYVSVITIPCVRMSVICTHIHRTIQSAAKCGRRRQRIRTWGKKAECRITVARRDEQPLTPEETHLMMVEVTFGRRF